MANDAERRKGAVLNLGALELDAPPTGLLSFPPEIMLHILSYLDLPELAIIAQLAPSLVPLTNDPVLHNQRLRIVYPSRVKHDLFGTSPAGLPFRPTMVDLVKRGVVRGLALERRFRMGAYVYSLNSIVQYEAGKMILRQRASHTISSQLRRRNTAGTPSNSLHTLYSTRVLPDVESSSPTIARSLLPVMRKLKWSFQKDKLAKVFKDSGIRLGVGAWLNSESESGPKGSQRRKVLPDTAEKVRLAVCPDIKLRRRFFERLSMN